MIRSLLTISIQKRHHLLKRLFLQMNRPDNLRFPDAIAALRVSVLGMAITAIKSSFRVIELAIVLFVFILCLGSSWKCILDRQELG